MGPKGGNGIEFAKKVGIVAGAVIACASIVSWTWGLATQPLWAEIRNEQRARVQADSMLAVTIRGMQHERLDLIDIMLAPPGPMREKKLTETRARWKEAH